MTADIKDILSNRFPAEPVEFAIIRKFIKKEFGVNPGLQLQGNNIVIVVSGSALAGALRLQMPELEQQLGSNHRVLIIKSA